MPDLPTLDEECFFITPIGEEGSDIRRRSDGILKYIVGRAATEVGLEAVRVDQLADPGQINLQVVDHVLNAKAAVADLTGSNANVFYEVAIRHTARLPLVLIAEKGSVLPFDIANMRTIFFDHTDLASADECRQAIVEALKSAIDGGIVDSPIGTSIDLSSMSSGNAVERGIADILSTLEELASEQRHGLAAVQRSRGSGRIHPAAIADAESALERLQDIASSADVAELAEAVADMRRPVRHIARMSSGRVHSDTDRFSPRGRSSNDSSSRSSQDSAADRQGSPELFDDGDDAA